MITEQQKPLFRKYSRFPEILSKHYDNYKEYKTLLLRCIELTQTIF